MIKSTIQSFIDDPFGTLVFLIVVISFISVLIWAVNAFIFNPRPVDVCAVQTSQTCIDKRFDECMATERYSRDECITIVGSGK